MATFLFYLFIALISCFIFLVSFPRFRQLIDQTIDDRTAYILLVGWTILATIEYWVFGPNSFAITTSELTYSIPGNYMFSQLGAQGQFIHEYAGGVDISATNIYTGNAVSLEQTLMKLFEPWAGVAIHKILIVGLSSFGVYAICRKSLGCDRVLSLALGAIYSQGFQAIAYYSFTHGLGYALIPLFVYVGVFRTDAPYYYLRVCALALVYSVSTSPTHSLIALFNALILAALLVPVKNYFRIFWAGAAVISAVVLNWSDSIIAKAAHVPLLTRTMGDVSEYLSTPDETWMVWFFGLIIQNRSTFLIGLCVLILIIWRKPSGWRRLGVICLLATFSGAIYQAFPWGVIGLSPLGGLNWSNAFFGALLINSLIFAKITNTMPVDVDNGRLLPASIDKNFLIRLMVAGACAQFVLVKAHNGLQWLGSGGINTFQVSLTRLQDVLPANETPVRTLTIPYRLYPNFTAAAGLDTIDGNYNPVLHRAAEFWARGLPMDRRHLTPTLNTSSYLLDGFGGWRIKCCNIHPIGKYININLLRIANVGYVVSTLPLQDAQFYQIAGPLEPVNPLPQDGLGVQWFTDRVALLFNPPPLYVYQITNPLPRVFAAKAVINVSPDIDDREFYERVAGEGLDGTVVNRNKESLKDLTGKDKMTVSAFRLDTDQVVASLTASSGGVLVVNIPYTPFWTASTDGYAVKIYPVNGIQMAVEIPAGTQEVKFHYKRSSFSEYLF